MSSMVDGYTYWYYYLPCDDPNARLEGGESAVRNKCEVKDSLKYDVFTLI